MDEMSCEYIVRSNCLQDRKEASKWSLPYLPLAWPWRVTPLEQTEITNLNYFIMEALAKEYSQEHLPAMGCW